MIMDEHVLTEKEISEAIPAEEGPSEGYTDIQEVRDLDVIASQNKGDIPGIYKGVSTHEFNDKQKDILATNIPSEDIDILPTGEVFVSQVRYRRILNAAFGPGAWAIIPTSKPTLSGNTIICGYAMFVNGKFVSYSMGEQDYHKDNPRTSYATALEATKSNALTRCCKDLGIASECWDKRFTETFKKQWCVRVWCDEKGKSRPRWRRKDSEPFYNETGFVETPMAKKVVIKQDELLGKETPPNESDFITPGQVKRFQAIASGSKWSDTQVKEFLNVKYGINSSKRILKRDYEEACNIVSLPVFESADETEPKTDKPLDLRAKLENALMELEKITGTHWMDLLREYSYELKNGKKYEATTMEEVMQRNDLGQSAWAESTYKKVVFAINEAQLQ